ncbi:MAG: hypothetical protein KGS60_14195 [Verrucomicrobia bacterium]|nr:hypothetical protein [Verrucomicrobiota bacterium]
MNVISIIIGIVTLILLIVGLVPLLGWINWLVVVLCVVGIVFGAVSKQKSGMVVNGAILVISLLRLFLGGGIL